LSDLDRQILEQVVAAVAEPVVIVRLDHTDWPVELANAAFASVGNDDAIGRPFAEVIEGLVGRELALEISESLRARQETGFPIETSGKEYLLALKPMSLEGEDSARYCAVFWRSGANSAAVADAETQHALLNAKRTIRDLTRDDPVTGLLNARAFRDVLEHDWAVAAREQSRLSLVLFTLEDFDSYVEVFGRHAADSCLRRVGQAVRRCMRRASDVVARLDDSRLVVLAHASDEDAVRDFAVTIGTAVRELGMHHPRSRRGRFVTVSQCVTSITAGRGETTAQSFLEGLLAADGGSDSGR
jgi:diguanylate cyclase (GGDEF)-like protein